MADQQDSLRIHLSLVSHTNIGKTTLARTLLMRDVGEIADRAHVTETTDDYLLARGQDGSELILWDTPNCFVRRTGRCGSLLYLLRILRQGRP